MKTLVFFLFFAFAMMSSQASSQQSSTAKGSSGTDTYRSDQGFVGGTTNQPKYDMTTKGGKSYTGMNPYSGPGVSYEVPTEPDKDEKDKDKDKDN